MNSDKQRKSMNPSFAWIFGLRTCRQIWMDWCPNNIVSEETILESNTQHDTLYMTRNCYSGTLLQQYLVIDKPQKPGDLSPSPTRNQRVLFAILVSLGSGIAHLRLAWLAGCSQFANLTNAAECSYSASKELFGENNWLPLGIENMLKSSSLPHFANFGTKKHKTHQCPRPSAASLAIPRSPALPVRPSLAPTLAAPCFAQLRQQWKSEHPEIFHFSPFCWLDYYCTGCFLYVQVKWMKVYQDFGTIKSIEMDLSEVENTLLKTWTKIPARLPTTLSRRDKRCSRTENGSSIYFVRLICTPRFLLCAVPQHLWKPSKSTSWFELLHLTLQPFQTSLGLNANLLVRFCLPPQSLQLLLEQTNPLQVKLRSLRLSWLRASGKRWTKTPRQCQCVAKQLVAHELCYLKAKCEMKASDSTGTLGFKSIHWFKALNILFAVLLYYKHIVVERNGSTFHNHFPAWLCWLSGLCLRECCPWSCKTWSI